MKHINDFLKASIYIVILIIISYSCNNNKSQYKHNNIIAQSLNVTEKTEFNAKNFIEDISYLKLSTSDPKSLFTEISKIEMKNNLIYLLDATGQHFVYIFKTDGSFVQRIGKKGKGPGEYTWLCDFDVDEKGNIYLCDLRSQRIIIYDIHNNVIDDKRMPFRADAFNLLQGGGFIFSAELNSSKPVNRSKVIITDSNFNIKQKYLTYAKNNLDNKGSNNIFRENKFGILYNKPVNDTIYEFSKTGELKKALSFDFGIKTVPQSLKNSYEQLASERKRNDFEYFNQPPMIVRNYILGNIFSGKNKAFMMYNLSNNRTFQHEISEKKFTNENINFPLTVINDSVVISYLDFQIYNAIPDKSNLSSDIQNHIQNGGTVLSFYRLK